MNSDPPQSWQLEDDQLRIGSSEAARGGLVEFIDRCSGRNFIAAAPTRFTASSCLMSVARPSS